MAGLKKEDRAVYIKKTTIPFNGLEREMETAA
jgi:hypothetical protein